MEKQEGFFSWVIRKWHFWLLSVGWGLLSSIEELRLGFISVALGTIAGWTFIMLIIYFIVFCIKKSITKQVQEELKSKNNKI